MRNGTLYVGSKGLTVFYHVDGEVTRSVDLVPGSYPVKPFLAARKRGEAVDFGKGQIVATSARICRENAGAQAFQSAANPQWRMSPSARVARDLRVQLNKVTAMQRSVDKGLQALKRAQAKKQEQAPVAPAQLAAPVSDAGISAS